MYGYIRTNRPELKVREDEIYKSVYCTVCRQLGKRYGVLARMFVSYDAAFLALFLMSGQNECASFEKMRCPYNPTKRCQRCNTSFDETIFAADVCVLLFLAKLRDNADDSNFFVSLLCKFLLLLLSRTRRRAKKNNPRAAEIVESFLSAQRDAEERGAGADEAAHPTGELLKSLIRLYFKDDCSDSEMTMYFVGRFVYLADAADDLEKDRKSGSYNPYVLANADNEAIRGDLLMTAGAAVQSFSGVKTYKFRSILDNILTDGLYNQAVRLTEKGERDNGKSV